MLYQSIRSETNYWRVDEPAWFTSDKLPAVIGYSADNTHFYGIPIAEYPGLLKVEHIMC